MRGILIPAACLLAATAAAWCQSETRASHLAEENAAPELLSQPRPKAASGWDAKAAAAYLDQRAGWWMAWPKGARDHETFCISCHTAVPYAMSRPALRRALGEQALSPNERRLLDNVTKRVRLWNEVAPFYSDADRGVYKTVESRGTESVLNALILASHDAQSGHLSDDTRAAFANMWAEQQTSGEQQGAWRWLRFKNEPWEADDSDFYGAALAAIATGTAPGNYRLRPEIQPNLQALRDYLHRQAASEPLMNRVVLLWASAKVPGLLDAAEQRAILTKVFAKQQADGGWSLPALAGDWKRHDDTPQDAQSDGYATGLIVFAMQEIAFAKDIPQPKSAQSRDNEVRDILARDLDMSSHLKPALNWLATHQNPSTGFWPSASLNKNEANHISPETARFMNDAATAYAVLALSETK